MPSPQRRRIPATKPQPSVCHVYARQSKGEKETAEEGGVSSSIRTQLLAIRQRLAERVQFHAYLHEETIECVSAGNLAKMTSLRRILATIDRARGDIIVVACADRLCRFDNAAERERLFAQRIYVVDKDIFYQGEPALRDQLTALFDAACAERARISERARARHQYMRTHGLAVYAPYGFRYNRERTLLFPHPLQYPMLRALMGLLSDDQTTVVWRLGVDIWATAAQVLNDIGYPYQRNRPWSRAIVFKIYKANPALGETAWLERYTDMCHRCPAAYDMYRPDQMSSLNVLLCQTCEAALVAEGVDVAHQAQFDCLSSPVAPRPSDPRVVAYVQYAHRVLGAVPMPAVLEAQELLAQVAPPPVADPAVDQLVEGLEAVEAEDLPPLEDPEDLEAVVTIDSGAGAMTDTE